MYTAIFICLLSLIVSPATSSQLTIQFSNLEASHVGKYIYIGIWHSNNASFPDGVLADIPIKRKINSVDFSLQTELEPREYAISVFVDLNGNGELDSNLFGIPLEPYGFYRDFRPTLSAPDFEDCSFYMDGDQQIKLTLIQ
ncbi:MAG: DUF2141 domain-containing protein [Bacteroidota bacterium]